MFFAKYYTVNNRQPFKTFKKEGNMSHEEADVKQEVEFVYNTRIRPGNDDYFVHLITDGLKLDKEIFLILRISKSISIRISVKPTTNINQIRAQLKKARLKTGGQARVLVGVLERKSKTINNPNFY